jgi:hypothetical protein
MIPPNIWGPDYWAFLHLLSTKYPNNSNPSDIKMMDNLIKSIYYILPCLKCAKHFKKNIKKFPLESNDLKSKDNLIKWFINFHNIINMSLNKSVISKTDALTYIIHESYYTEYLIKILSYIEYGIDNETSYDRIEGIKKFIIAALYFSGKKIDDNDIKFKNYASYRVVKKYIIRKISK